MLSSTPSPARRGGILALALALGLAGVLGAGAAETPGRPRNLILVSIDTLRPDRLGCYGHPRSTSPAIDAIAKRGLLFEDVVATSPWTKPSHASILTGRYPGRHGAVSMTASLSERTPHLAALLAARGYRTAALVNSTWLSEPGMKRGFEDFEWVRYVQGRREGSPMTDTALAWLKRVDGERPFFLFLHYMDVHSDYASLPKYERMFVGEYAGPIDGSTRQLYRHLRGELRIDDAGAAHLRDLYDAGIRQLDDRLARLIAELRERGLLERSLLVVTSDHGEEFLEHGGVIHGYTQFEEVTRVPLLLHGPGVPPGRVSTPVSLVDLMPTCLELLGAPIPAGLDGINLRPVWEANTTVPPRALFMEASSAFPPRGPGQSNLGPHRALRLGRFKLHYHTTARRYALYDLSRDPAERSNVSSRHPAVTEVLLRHIRCHMQATPTSAPCPAPDGKDLQVLRTD